VNTPINLSLGEKLKHIRTAQGISQENVAKIIKKNKSDISRIENGKAEPSDDALKAIRRFLGIDKAPLLPLELELYRNRLLICNGLLDTNRPEDARAMQPELEHILALPYEYDLIAQYRMLEIRIMIREKNLTDAMEQLVEVEPLLNHVSNKTLCGYHSNKAFFCTISNNPRSAADHYLIALGLVDKDDTSTTTRLLASIGTAYSALGKHHHAIRYYERALDQFKGGVLSYVIVPIQGAAAVSYYCVGEYAKAEKVANLAIPHAKSINDNTSHVTLLNALVAIKIDCGDYDAAMSLINEADAILENTITNYASVFEMRLVYLGFAFNKVSCLAKMNRHQECHEIVDKCQIHVQGDESLAIILATISHMITFDAPDSIAYIEDVAIPHFAAMKPHGANLTTTLCKELIAYYTKKKSKTKLAYIKAIMYDIYEEIFIGE